MYDELKNKQVKVRKKHDCGWCNEDINVGELAQYRVYIYDMDFKTDYMHPECVKAMNDTEWGDEVEWREGENERGKVIDWENY